MIRWRWSFAGLLLLRSMNKPVPEQGLIQSGLLILGWLSWHTGGSISMLNQAHTIKLILQHSLKGFHFGSACIWGQEETALLMVYNWLLLSRTSSYSLFLLECFRVTRLFLWNICGEYVCSHQDSPSECRNKRKIHFEAKKQLRPHALEKKEGIPSSQEGGIEVEINRHAHKMCCMHIPNCFLTHVSISQKTPLACIVCSSVYKYEKGGRKKNISHPWNIHKCGLSEHFPHLF